MSIEVALQPSNMQVSIFYRNWRGEVAWRKIVPASIYFGSTEWHPQPQWFLKALDVEKQAERDFAIKDIINWQPD
jgi:predicted DNA-binding transcriptional regulator YafY